MNFELQILDTLQTLHGPIMDKLMIGITSLGNAGIFWICLALVLLVIPKTRKLGIILAVSLVLDVIICNGLLKPLIARTRPYDIRGGIDLIVSKPHDYSFPPGHTAASFTSAFALLFSGKRKAGIAALILATLIAFSRLYLYVHFPTDVLGGIVIGLLCGYLGNKIVLCIANKKSQEDL